MIRFTCCKCGGENYVLWEDITRIMRCKCIKCGVSLIFLASTEEDLIRRSFKRKEKEDAQNKTEEKSQQE